MDNINISILWISKWKFDELIPKPIEIDRQFSLSFISYKVCLLDVIKALTPNDQLLSYKCIAFQGSKELSDAHLICMDTPICFYLAVKIAILEYPSKAFQQALGPKECAVLSRMINDGHLNIHSTTVLYDARPSRFAFFPPLIYNRGAFPDSFPPFIPLLDRTGPSGIFIGMAIVQKPLLKEKMASVLENEIDSMDSLMIR